MCRKAVLFILLIFLSGCLSHSSGKVHRYHELLLDTLIEIDVYSKKDEKAVKEAFREIERINKLISRYEPNSEVSLINRFAGIKPVKVSKETFFVIEEGLRICKMSDGALDITIGPIVDLWGFNKREKQNIPTKEQVAETLKLVDYRLVYLDKANSEVMLKKKGMSLDLGSVGKGYAIEQAAVLMAKMGVTDAIINAGGNVKLIGQSWRRVGIEHPRKKNSLLGVLRLRGSGVSTAGDYQRYFIKDNVRYSHIFDPKTGFPARKFISITVISPVSAFESDLLDTALFVMGPEKAKVLLAQFPKIRVIGVTEDEKIFGSEDIKNDFTFK